MQICTSGKISIVLTHFAFLCHQIQKKKASGRPKHTPEVFGSEEYWNDEVVAPSGGPDFKRDQWRHIPRGLSIDEIQDVVKAFGAAAARADQAGMDTVEIQGAYGYLIHTFLSPLSNHRTDKYGGSLENRARLLLEVVREVRANFSAEKPIFLRLSVSDCVEHFSNTPSFVIEEAVQVAQWAKEAGLDIIHVAAGGNTPLEKIPRFPGYLVHYAARIRQDVPGLAVVAVGTINSGKQAQEIVESGKADLVAAASAFLKHPTFALDAGRELGVDVTYAPQYAHARYA